MKREPGISTSLFWPMPLARAIASITGSGFTTIEVSPAHLLRDLARLPDVVAVARRAGVEQARVWSVHCPFGGDYELGRPLREPKERWLERILMAARTAHNLEAKTIVVHPSDLARASVPSVGETLRRSLERVKLGAEVCQGFGLTLAVELMLPHLVGGRADEVAWLCEHLPRETVGICADVGHAAFSGDIPAALESVKERLILVHATDNAGHRDDHLFPGEGTVNWAQVLSALDEAGYEGPIIIEPAPRQMSREALAARYREMVALFGTGSAR